jgi:nucleolar protein TMA23
MDAHAYLIKHGWSGPGNPLNPSQRPGLHGGLGLTRPILVARKSNNHGVGKKTTKDATNQWWLRGFEDALKGVGDDSFEANSARQNNALTSELYRHFVRGSGLAGTLDPKESEDKDKAVSASTSSSKRKREDRDDSKAGKAARKEERAAKRAQKAVKKEEKAERKEARRVKKVEKIERRQKREAEKVAKKTKKAAEKNAEDYPTPMLIDESEQTEKIDLDKAAARLQKKEKKKKSTESVTDSKKES